MAKVFYNNKTNHEVYDCQTDPLKAKKLSDFDDVVYDEGGIEVSRSNDYQEVELGEGEAQYVDNGVLKKKTKADIEAEDEVKKAGKKVKKDAVLAKLGITEEELKDLLN